MSKLNLARASVFTASEATLSLSISAFGREPKT
jgi:hypothetical protein